MSIIVLIFYIEGVGMISDEELLAKVEADEDLTVNEIKRYNQLVKPQKQVYGQYGTLKRIYLEDKESIGQSLIFPNICTAWTSRQRICTMFSMQSF